ncbi:2-oxoglutarate dehydrogenase E1 component [Pseudoscourfieldia marina]
MPRLRGGLLFSSSSSSSATPPVGGTTNFAPAPSSSGSSRVLVGGGDKNPTAPTNWSEMRDDFLSPTSMHYLEYLAMTNQTSAAASDLSSSNRDSGTRNPKTAAATSAAAKLVGHESWRDYFAKLDAAPLTKDRAALAEPVLADVQMARTRQHGAHGTQQSTAALLSSDDFSARVLMLTRAYQVIGHHRAKLDPLQLYDAPTTPELELSTYGLTPSDLDRPVPWVPGEGVKMPVAGHALMCSTDDCAVAAPESTESITLRQAIDHLEDVYCSSIGYEFMHISDKRKCDWIRRRIEAWPPSKLATSADGGAYTREEKLRTLDRLLWSELFETFCSTKYGAAKRFGLEGGESFTPGLKALIDRAVESGVESVTLGMAHRGRLNVLANVVRKPLRQIFAEFQGTKPESSNGDDDKLFMGSGDVKYHLGTSYDRPTTHGGHVHLCLLANPSHLEAVDPVVLGKVRAKQHYASHVTPSGGTLPVTAFNGRLYDNEVDQIPNGDAAQPQQQEVRGHHSPKRAHLPILIHGDGSFAGQGVVYETLDMSCLKGYEVGGTIHVVLNNQVAFTTDPKQSRSTYYCTDVAKTIDAPIIHVNGDDVFAVQFAMEFAAEYRQEFGRDIVVDVWCYRRQGHNEIDEPSFTQPGMYQAIAKHPLVTETFARQLVKIGLVTDDEVEEMKARIFRLLDAELQASKTHVSVAREWLASLWEGFKSPDSLSKIRNTGVPIEILREIGKRAAHIPSHVTPHRGVRRVYANRLKMVSGKEGSEDEDTSCTPVDWSFAETLAFASLLMEGYHVRLSGQDVERGTFSQRHLVVHEQKPELVGDKYIPLCHMYEHQPRDHFTVVNSSLSEFGVLGFELGYSLENPNALVLWEAQFGDFANSAQIIFDQFLSSGEAKWLRMSGLTVLLPHGYDGQGPEHSSARIERFLQMVDEDPRVMPEMEEQHWFHGGHLGCQTQSVNWQIANVSTPANYFHLLRRQVHREFRKPLIVFTPKSLLRHPKCVSPLLEFDDQDDPHELQGPRFRRLIMDNRMLDKGPDPLPKLDHVERLIFCSGKVYYDLAALREKEFEHADDPHQCKIAICRIEQLAPFPFDLVRRELRRYPNAQIVFCQEEPLNMGPYWYAVPRIETCMKAALVSKNEVLYAGRAPSASPATGFAAVHQHEQSMLCHKALGLVVE